MTNKIDSNFTGLRYTLEVLGTPKTLPGSPVWKGLEPNSYTDFGGTTTLTPRKPIVANRQLRKGRTTDIEAKAGFALDFTSDNMLDIAPIFWFANWRKDATTEVKAITSTVASTHSYDLTGGFATGFQVGSLVLATGFTHAANNGLKIVTTQTADVLTCLAGGIVDETPPATAMVKCVGFKSAAGDLDVDATNPVLPAITSTVLDFTTLGLIPGQWVCVGGDGSLNVFSNAGNNGMARIYSIAAGRLVFDKTQNTMTNETNTTQTVELFFGDYLMNENDPTLIVQQTLQLERSLSSAGFEYIEGCYGNTLDVEMKSADKITMALGFIALTTEQVTFGDRKSGTFPDIATDPAAYNTSTDLVRIRASEQLSASPLFAFMQTMTLKINNNVSPLKALGVLGAFDVTVGDFAVTGDITAYFSDIAAVTAIKHADTLTLDWTLALANRGWVFDLPTLTFDKGLLVVAKDQPVTIPVGINAAEDTGLKTTLAAEYFAYLPTIIAP